MSLSSNAPIPKIAVVGAGLIGAKHIEVAAAKGALAAIIDPSPAASAMAQEKDVAYFADLDTALDAGGIDGVILATPNQLHSAQALACIAHGIPVLIEKPITDLASSGEAVVNAGLNAGVPIAVGHHRRHNAIAQTTRKIVEDGRLGRIVSINALFLLHKPDDYFDVAWRRKQGAGPIYINLIHDLDLLRYFCGEVVSVQAMGSNAVRGFDVEDTASICLRFASGALATIAVSDCVSAPWSWEMSARENPAYPITDQSCYTISGTHGALSIPDMTFWQHPGKRSWWAPIDAEKIEVTPNDPFVAQFENFLDVVRGTKPPVVSGAEGLATLQVLEAVVRAMHTGQTEAP